MKALRLRAHYSVADFFVFVALFCVSTFALLEHASISVPMFSQVKFPLLIVGGVALLTQFKLIINTIFKKKYFFVMLLLLFFFLMLSISMLVNRNLNFGFSTVRNTSRLMLYLFELFVLMMVLAETGRGKKTLDFLFKYLLMLAVVTDVFLLTGLVTFRSGRFESYLIGSKFSVAYLHMNLLGIWVVRMQRKKQDVHMPRWLILVLSLLIIWVSIRVNCMTGVLGCVMLVILMLMIRRSESRRGGLFTSPVILLLLLAGSVVFSLVAEEIVSIPFVRDFVEDVLSRDVTLTGRLQIFFEYADKLQGRWLNGFGYGNGNVAAVRLFGYENAQNGLLQWVLQVGILSTSAMILWMLQIFRQANRLGQKRSMEIMPLVALIYVYIAIGTAETSFDMCFLMWFGLLFMLSSEKEWEQTDAENHEDPSSIVVHKRRKVVFRWR